jgi:hypothetical protein
MSMKNSYYTIGNRTRDLPACSAVPQSTAPPRAPVIRQNALNFVLRFIWLHMSMHWTAATQLCGQLGYSAYHKPRIIFIKCGENRKDFQIRISNRFKTNSQFCVMCHVCVPLYRSVCLLPPSPPPPPIIIIIIIFNVVSCHRPFLPGTSLEPAVIPTAQASSFTLQYFPYYVLCSKYSCLL